MQENHPKVKFGKTGILLVNLGTPDSTSWWDIRKYLKEFLSDRRVIEVNPIVWQIILNLFILTFRPSKTAHAYKKIWRKDTNESPLLYFTRSQAEKLKIKIGNDKIIVDEFYKTNVEGFYAIGDVVSGPALAHVASAEGITCVENIKGLNTSVIDYNNIPGCTYCKPEIASVGFTEKQAIDNGYEIKVGKFPFSASGKAQSSGAPEGFVKVIFDAKYGEWLGCHMIGSNVTEMISEAVVGRKLETTGHEILKAVHPHPTLSEAVMEAVADAYGEVIHL